MDRGSASFYEVGRGSTGSPYPDPVDELRQAEKAKRTQFNISETAKILHGEAVDPNAVAPVELRGRSIFAEIGGKRYAVTFKDDVDKALYMIDDPATPGDLSAKLTKWIEQTTGEEYTKIRAQAAQMRADVRKIMQQHNKPPKRPYVKGMPPSNARVANEIAGSADEIARRVNEKMAANWGKTTPVISDANLERALKDWSATAKQNISEAKLLASQVGNAARDFALHDYRKKTGFDMALGYIFPYNYWYTRTYLNWMKRLVYEPEVIAAYAKYKDAMAAAHAGAPEWWKYNVNTNELLGIDSENPLFINAEATLNPLYGIMGVDFNDPVKRTDGVSIFLDELKDYGPSPWTIYGIANAMAQYAKGEEKAGARWAGRLFPQTKDIRNLLSAMNINFRTKGGYNEFDPFVYFLSNGLDP